MLKIIGGIFKRRQLQVPTGLSTRPTSSRLRESVFNILQNVIEEAKVLDLFAGSGAIGLEALSRGAKMVTFVEMERSALTCLKANVEALGVKDQTQIFFKDGLAFLKETPATFDIIYIDPPYGLERQGSFLSAQLLSIIDEKKLLADNGDLFLEEMELDALKMQSLKNLVLCDMRKMGRSWLYHYQRKK